MGNDVDEIFDTLDKAHERLREIKEERNKLLEANKELVNLLLGMEDNLDKSDFSLEELDDHSYSFDDGWVGHKGKLKVEDGSLSELEKQIKEIRKLSEDVDDL